MSTPSLALNVSASGAAEVIALAGAVDSLRNSLAQLATQAKASGIGGLEQMSKDFRNVRAQLTRTMNGLSTDITSDYKRLETQIKQGSAAVANAATQGGQQVQAAMNRIHGKSGSIQSTIANAQLMQTATALAKVGTSAQQTGPQLQSLSHTMNNAHSAARGLASGFGAMWLTWGNLVPLLAGAALSHTFVQTIKLGADVQNTFTQIKVLAGETAETVGLLTDKMHGLARSGQFGPQEIANGMKLLTLAGLDAKKAYSAINDVLNFAVAGDMKIDKAADVMTTVATAFNVSAENYSYVADVIAKSAAESKSSVEGMGEAFKTASVIHQQYGASLEDVGVSLALLANAGIQNTAAGTALRNMYVDLAGRTPKVQKALDDLGVKTLDPVTGKLKAQSVVLKDLIEALSKLKPTEQFKTIQDIFSERGGKAGVAAMNAMMQTIRENGIEIGTVYDNLMRKVNESAGFAAIAAAEMSLTPLNQMKATAATMQSVLVEAFNEIQPVIVNLTFRLRELFKSEEFRSAVQDIIALVGQATIFIIEHGRAIASVVLAYMGFRSVVGVLQTVEVALAAVAAMQARVVAANAAAAAATGVAATAAAAGGATAAAGLAKVSVAARLAAFAHPILAAISAVVTVGAGAWALYEMWLGKSTKGTADFANSANNKALLERLNDEADRLDKVNEARARNISLLELEAEMALEKAKAAPPVVAPLQKQLADLDAKIAAEKTVAPQNRTLYAWEQQGNAGSRLKALETERANLAKQIAQHEADQLETVKQIERVKLRLQAGSKQAADAARARQLELNTPVQGTGVRPTSIKGLGGDGSLSISDLKDEAVLADLRAVLEARLSALVSAYNKEKSVLEAKHSAGLISEGTYQAALLNMIVASEEKQRTALSEEAVKWAAEWQKQYSAVKDSKLSVGDKGKAIKSLQSEWDKYFAKLHGQFEKLEDEGMGKQETAIIKMQGDTKKLIEANDEYWIKAEQGAIKEAKLAQLRHEMAFATEEERLAAEAVLKVTEKHQPEIEKLQTAYAKAVKELSDFNSEVEQGNVDSEMAKTKYAAMAQRVIDLGNALELTGEQLEKLQKIAAKGGLDQAGTNAATKLRKDFEEGSKRITSDLADAILDGGKEGGRKLKDYLKDLFIRQPLKAVLQVLLQPVGNMVQGSLMGIMGGNALGGAAGGTSGGGLSSIMQMFNGGGVGGLSNSIFDTGFNMWAADMGSVTDSIGSFMMDNADTISTIGAGLGYFSAISSAADGKWGTAAGQAIGTFLLPGIGTVVGGMLGGFVDDLFGGGGGPKVEGSYGIGGNGVGVFGNQLDQMATQAVMSVSTTFQNMAKSLGIAFSDISFGLGVSTDPEGDSPSFVQAAMYRNGQQTAEFLDLNVGRTDEELQKAVEAATTRMLVTALQTLDVSEKFKLVISQLDVNSSTEILQQKINRILIAKEVEDSMMGLGQAFEFVAAMSVDAINRMVELGGGIQTFASGVNAYRTNFFSPEEQRTQLAGQVATTLNKDLGLAFSTQEILNWTREGFRAWVEMLDTSSEWGQAAFASAMKVAGAMAELTPIAEAAASAIDDTASKLKEITDERLALEKRMYEVQGKTYILKALERAEYDASNVALFDYVTALEEAREAVNKALDAELAALDEKLSKEKETASFYKNLADSLRKYRDDLTQGDLSPLTPGQKYLEASNLFQSTYDAALGGDQDAAGRLQQVAEDFLRASQVYNASGEQYQYDFARVMSALTISIAKADETASYASQQVTLLTEQKAYLQQQVDQLFGISNAIMSLAEAMGNYQAVYNSPPSSTVQALYQNLLGRAPDPEGEMYWNLRLAQGASYQDITYGFLNSPEFRNRIQTMVDSGAVQQAWTVLKSTGLTMAELNGGMGFQSYQLEQWAQANGLPVFHGGTSMVPRTGFALLERGEAVLSRGQVNSETAALLVELREMKQLLMAQIEANDAAHERTANHIVQGTVSAKRRANFEQSNARQARALA